MPSKYADKDTLIKLCEVYTIAAVAEKLGCHIQTVKWLRKKYGLVSQKIKKGVKNA